MVDTTSPSQRKHRSVSGSFSEHQHKVSDRTSASPASTSLESNMDLVVDYECTRCHTTFSKHLLDIYPGHKRNCPQCNAEPLMTRESLKKLRRALANLND